MAIKRIDNLSGKDLAAPYYRVSVNIEQVYVDEQHPFVDGGPSNRHINNQMSEMQTLKEINVALVTLGLQKITAPK